MPKKTPIENPERDVLELKARVEQLEHALLQNEEPVEHLFNLPSTLANLFGLLLTKPFVSARLAQYEMNVVANAQVSIHRLRTRLTPLGIEIRTRRKVGWYLDEETKERIRLRIAHHPTGEDDGKTEDATPVNDEEADTYGGQEVDTDPWGIDGYDQTGDRPGESQPATGTSEPNPTGDAEG